MSRSRILHEGADVAGVEVLKREYAREGGREMGRRKVGASGSRRYAGCPDRVSRHSAGHDLLRGKTHDQTLPGQTTLFEYISQSIFLLLLE